MRILLVEDEPRVAHFIAKGLREQSYAVDIAGDGEFPSTSPVASQSTEALAFAMMGIQATGKRLHY